MEITAAIPAEDLAELNRVCRVQHVSQADAVHEALRFYIDREGNLPTIEYGDDPDLA